MDVTNSSPIIDPTVEHPMFELVVSYVPRQSALIRISAPTKELAEEAVHVMASKSAQDLIIESIEEVSKDAPIPDDYEETASQEGIIETKVLH